MKTTMRGLSSYQRKQIIFLATTEQYSEAERVKLLRSLSYCTDAVKFAVLKEEISTTLYKRLIALYSIKPAGRRQWTYDETIKLIDCYNRNISTKEMSLLFGASAAAINCRISWLRNNPLYSHMFTLKKYTRRAEAKA